MNLVVRAPATTADVIGELARDGAISVSTATEQLGSGAPNITTVVYLDGDATTTLTPALLDYSDRDAVLRRHGAEMKRIGLLLEGAAARGARTIALATVSVSAAGTLLDLVSHHSWPHILTAAAASGAIGAVGAWLGRRIAREVLVRRVRQIVTQQR